jgi:hypothetical protein
MFKPDTYTEDFGLLNDAERATTGANIHRIRQKIHLYKNCIALLRICKNEAECDQFLEEVKKAEEALRRLVKIEAAEKRIL